MSDDAIIEFFEGLVEELQDIRYRIDGQSVKSRELSIVMTKIQEAEMWLNEEIDSLDNE